MKKAVIVYNSKSGTTKKLGEGIYDYLHKNGISAHIRSIDEFDYSKLPEYDLFFLGCWTSGFLFFLQRPEKIWIDFAQKLPVLRSGRTILFTTYKIRTGSMFGEMRKCLRFSDDSEGYGKLKSRDGKLNIKNQMIIDERLKSKLDD
ncbi:MAG: flavodoxin family protein [Methanococcaceae archaeon]